MHLDIITLQIAGNNIKGDVMGEKSLQTADSAASFRNILAEKLTEKGSTVKGEVLSEKSLTEREKEMRELLSDPFFYFAAQFGFLDNLKNFLQSNGNTGEIKLSEEAIGEILSSGNSIEKNNELASMLEKFQKDGSITVNKEALNLSGNLQNDSNFLLNKTVAQILENLQQDSNLPLNKEATQMLLRLQQNSSMSSDGEVTQILENLRQDSALPLNKELTQILAQLNLNNSISEKQSHMSGTLRNDNSISFNKELDNIMLSLTNIISRDMSGEKLQTNSDMVSALSGNMLKSNTAEKTFKDILSKASLALKNFINELSSNQSDKLPEVTSIKDLLTQISGLGDSLKDIIKKSDYKELEGLVSKSPFLTKIKAILNLFDEIPDNSEKQKNLSDILSRANSILSSLEDSIKEGSDKNSLKEHIKEYKSAGISGKEEQDIFLVQQKTLDAITRPVYTKNNGEIKTYELDLSSQIVKKIDWKNTEKNSLATITLEPESLGKMRVEVNLAASGEISARFFTQNKQTGDLLSEQLNQLKQSLSEQGLKLGSFSVLTEDGSSSGFQNPLSDFNEKKYVTSMKNDKEDYSPGLNNKISDSQMDYFV